MGHVTTTFLLKKIVMGYNLKNAKNYPQKYRPKVRFCIEVKECVVSLWTDDKDTLTLKTSSLRLMDMITIFNKKCREKEASG